MDLPAHFDDEFDFEGRLAGRSLGYKRSSPAYDDEDYDADPFTSKKLEKAEKKKAAFIVTFVKREQEIAELKARSLLVDPAIHEELARLKMHGLVKKVALQKSQNTELINQIEGVQNIEGLTNVV